MEYIPEPTEEKPKKRFIKDPAFLSFFAIPVYMFVYNPIQKKIVFATSDALAVHPSWLKYLGYIFLLFVTFVISEGSGQMELLPNSWSKKPWKEKRKPLFIAGLILFLFFFITPFFCRSELYDETVKSRFVVEQLSKNYNLAQAESMQVGFKKILQTPGHGTTNRHPYKYKVYVSYKFGNKEFKFYNDDFEDAREMISVIEKYKDVLPLDLKRDDLKSFVLSKSIDESLQSLRLYIKELFEEE
ncbi:MAG: hypothetical protein K5930_01460 [Treponemataceae bacterium]|nr:hypothetical protein [Treponemataceae bacterium]